MRNWGHRGNAKILVNGAVPEKLRQGTSIDTDGNDYLVVWVEIQSTEPIEFSISGAQPMDTYSAPDHIALEAKRAENAQKYSPPKRARKKRKKKK